MPSSKSNLHLISKQLRILLNLLLLLASFCLYTVSTGLSILAFFKVVPSLSVLEHLRTHDLLRCVAVVAVGLNGALEAVFTLAWMLFGGPHWLRGRVHRLSRPPSRVRTVMAFCLMQICVGAVAAELVAAASLVYMEGSGDLRRPSLEEDKWTMSMAMSRALDRSFTEMGLYAPPLVAVSLASAIMKAAFLCCSKDMLRTSSTMTSAEGFAKDYPVPSAPPSIKSLRSVVVEEELNRNNPAASSPAAITGGKSNLFRRKQSSHHLITPQQDNGSASSSSFDPTEASKLTPEKALMALAKESYWISPLSQVERS